MNNHSQLPGQHYTRPLAKCIEAQFIREWVAEQDLRRVHITQALNVIKVHYCAALVGRGVCPIDCANCREAITSMFPLTEARNPVALLTWRAKDRSAAMIEKLIEAQKNEPMEEFPSQETPTDDPFYALRPKQKAENLFLEMEQDYE